MRWLSCVGYDLPAFEWIGPSSSIRITSCINKPHKNIRKFFYKPISSIREALKGVIAMD